MSFESLTSQITSVQFAREFARESSEFASYLNEPGVLAKLRDQVLDPVIKEPVNIDSFDEFCNSYVTDAIVNQRNWLQIIFRDSRFDLFTSIVKNDPEVCREVLPYIDSVPLSTFQVVWSAIGDENDLLTVLLSKVLQTFEKEDRVMYALRIRPIRKKTARVLCLESIQSAPIVFAELAKSWPSQAEEAISYGLKEKKGLLLNDLVNFETSLLLVEGDKVGAKIFSKQLLQQRLQEPFSYEEVSVAWKFFSRQYDATTDGTYLRSLFQFLRKDNRLWFVSNLMDFYNLSLNSVSRDKESLIDVGNTISSIKLR